PQPRRGVLRARGEKSARVVRHARSRIAIARRWLRLIHALAPENQPEQKPGACRGENAPARMLADMCLDLLLNTARLFAPLAGEVARALAEFPSGLRRGVPHFCRRGARVR